MTDMKDPVRLSLGGSPDAQAVLRSVRSELPTRGQLDHLAGRLAPVVTAAPAASSILPWFVAGVVVLGAAGVMWLGRDRSSASPQPVASTPARVEVRTEAPPAPTPIVVPPPVIADEPPASAPVRAQAKKKHKDPKSDVVKTVAPQPREMDLLGPAHDALAKREHARALQLAVRHAELYPSGSFVEEREAIAIEALLRLGRDEARTRFDEFVVTYPRSGYRPRLERLFGESSR